jgi:hypothetical protein
MDDTPSQAGMFDAALKNSGASGIRGARPAVGAKRRRLSVLRARVESPSLHRAKAQCRFDRAERRSSCCVHHESPLRVPATAIATSSLFVVPFALPCITHENNSTTPQHFNRSLKPLSWRTVCDLLRSISCVRSLDDPPGRARHFADSIPRLRHWLPVPIFPMRRVRSEELAAR